jgi:diaminopropionate ammonia-lyase
MFTPTHFPVRHVHNDQADPALDWSQAENAILSEGRFRAARDEITTWPAYAPTPLIPLPGLAAHLGIGAVLYKDEGKRLGLRSFKALGGAYSVLGALQERLGAHVTAADLAAGLHRETAAGVTVAAATDGNHGRSVAWGAQMFGCKCVIYLHEYVSKTREAEIARFGAEIRRVPGHYDDSVRACARDTARYGWTLVADTSSDPADPVPARVMQGYTLIVEELLSQTPEPPTHVFVQAGVGGLAAAVAGHYRMRLQGARPRIIVVEPDRADCVFRSVAAGRPAPVPGSPDTFMACLAAGEVSAPAWVILQRGIDDAITLPDDAARDAMRLLAEGVAGDPPIVAGESGCAAIAGLIAAALDPQVRVALSLDARSRVVCIGSEGATDEEAYNHVVGRKPEEVEPA